MSESDQSCPSHLTAIVVETSSVRHKSYGQDSQDDSYSEHQRHSKVPAMPQELKQLDEAAVIDDDEKKNLKTVKSDNLKHRESTSHNKLRGRSPEKNTIAAIAPAKHKIPLVQPIPTVDESKSKERNKLNASGQEETSLSANVSDKDKDKEDVESTSPSPEIWPEESGTRVEVAAEGTQGTWSEGDEEAGGLPCDAHGSRVARAFRRLLCLGADDTDDFDIKPSPAKHEDEESPRTLDPGI